MLYLVTNCAVGSVDAELIINMRGRGNLLGTPFMGSRVLGSIPTAFLFPDTTAEAAP